MAKRVQSSAQKEYQKERERLLKAVQRGEKEGYIYPEDVVPALPKRVTRKRLEEIKATKPKDLKQKAKRIDLTTGELVPVSAPKKPAKNIPSISTSSKATQEPVRIGRIPAKIKPKLTPEQRHLINVERGKKAWATRRAKMSDEEFEAFKAETKARFKKARDLKRGIAPVETPTDVPYYPKITAVDAVMEKLKELDRSQSIITTAIQEQLITLKRESPPWFPIETRKNQLIAIFEDTINTAEDLSELDKYLVDNMEEIDKGLNIIRWSSMASAVEASFATLGKILNRGALTPTQAESLSQMSEYEYYGDIE